MKENCRMKHIREIPANKWLFVKMILKRFIFSTAILWTLYAWISPQAKNWLLVLRLLALGFKGLCEIGPLFIVAQIYDKSRCYALFIVVKSYSNRYPHCIHTTELSMATVACCERHNGSLSTCFADLTLKKELNCLVKVACTINNIELYYTVNKPHINTCSY